MKLTFDDVDKLVELSQGSDLLGDCASWVEDLYINVYDSVKTRVNYYRFLRRFTMMYKPTVVLELGVEYGVASAMMAYHGVCHVVGIDVNTNNSIGRVSAMCHNFKFLHGDTIAMFPIVKSFVEKYGRLGLVFQDSSHHYLTSMREWELYSQLLEDDAVWICDDITPAFYDPNVDPPGMGMVQYFDSLPGRKKLYPDLLHYGNTVGVVLQ